MPIDVLIARWLAVFWIIAGLSHALHPKLWADLLMPLRDRQSGAFLLAMMGLPIGLVIILGHNIWVWDLPVIVTIAGWLSTIKCTAYMLLPRAHRVVMPVHDGSDSKAVWAFRVIGLVMVALGSLTAYDAFWRR